MITFTGYEDDDYSDDVPDTRVLLILNTALLLPIMTRSGSCERCDDCGQCGGSRWLPIPIRLLCLLRG